MGDQASEQLAASIAETAQPELPVTEPEAEFVTSMSVLGDRLGGADRKTIQRLMKLDGCPGRTDDGRYDVGKWRVWVQAEDRLKRHRSSTDKQTLQVRELTAKIEAQELQNAQSRGDLITIDECTRILSAAFRGFADRLLGAKHTLSPQVVGLPVPEASKRIGAEHFEALSNLSLGEWAKKKASAGPDKFWSKVSAHLSDLLKNYSLGDGLNAT